MEPQDVGPGQSERRLGVACAGGAAAKAKPDALGQLLAEIPHLRRYARVLLRDPWAEDDLVQSSLERALSRLEQWRPERPLRPWLLAIMHNLHVSALRRGAAGPPFSALDEEGTPSAAAGQDLQLEARQVLAAARQLPEGQRRALILVAVEDMSYQQAADTLDIPVGTLMSRLHRGRTHLRGLLG